VVALVVHIKAQVALVVMAVVVTAEELQVLLQRAQPIPVVVGAVVVVPVLLICRPVARV
jgi:hypothetical protein